MDFRTASAKKQSSSIADSPLTTHVYWLKCSEFSTPLSAKAIDLGQLIWLVLQTEALPLLQDYPTTLCGYLLLSAISKNLEPIGS